LFVTLPAIGRALRAETSASRLNKDLSFRHPLTLLRLTWIDKLSRLFSLPAGMDPKGPNAINFSPGDDERRRRFLSFETQNKTGVFAHNNACPFAQSAYSRTSLIGPKHAQFALENGIYGEFFV